MNPANNKALNISLLRILDRLIQENPNKSLINILESHAFLTPMYDNGYKFGYEAAPTDMESSERIYNNVTNKLKETLT